ncbi:MULTISPECIES: hypothetical protein [Micromonospora]|uniref:CBM2 domain-containing protein n=1 Tax=Micromonospora profundi TaxID=1420889 RepID=A0AAJ6HN95_9ACTN|nr:MULTISPECIES: hypothetical protein [Micromonospora]KOX13409.1 hypothetical protein ADK66_04140 [Micromonospora sp. NRRL B-16802]NJC11283.1 hypothetical protein [Micromonospora profundi]WLS43107.1 hypothetical protein Q3V37_16870 [Micromonospora profundi]
MAVRPDGAEGSRAARVLVSVPWIVVLVGVCALVVLLVIALLSFRGRERDGGPQAAPPVFLPTVPPASSSAASPTPAAVERRTASPRPSRSTRTPSPQATTPSPGTAKTSAPPAGLAPANGVVTARYQVGTSDSDAVLSLRNESDRPVGWRVELAYADDVRGLRVSGEAGISVSAQGGGKYVVSGGASLVSGGTSTLRLRLGWSGSAQRPSRCTINGAACRIG